MAGSKMSFKRNAVLLMALLVGLLASAMGQSQAVAASSTFSEEDANVAQWEPKIFSSEPSANGQITLREARVKLGEIVARELAAEKEGRASEGTDPEAVQRKSMQRRAEEISAFGRDSIAERAEENKRLLVEYQKLLYGDTGQGWKEWARSGLERAMWEARCAVGRVYRKLRGLETENEQHVTTIPIDEAVNVPVEQLRAAGAKFLHPRTLSDRMSTEREPRLHARQAKATTKKVIKSTTRKKGPTTTKKKVITTKKRTTSKKRTTTKKVVVETPLLQGKPVLLLQSTVKNVVACDTTACRIVTNRALATRFQRYCFGATRASCTTAGVFFAANDRNGRNCLTRAASGALVLVVCPAQLVALRRTQGLVFKRDLEEFEHLEERQLERAEPRIVVRDQLFTLRTDSRIQIMSNNRCISNTGVVLREAVCTAAARFTLPDAPAIVVTTAEKTTTKKSTTTTKAVPPTTTTKTTTTTLGVTATTSTSSTAPSTISFYPIPGPQVDIEPPKENTTAPLPNNLKVTGDEYVATLTWEEGYGGLGPNKPLPASWDPDRFTRFGITGFVVRWGEVGTTGTNSYTPWTAIQLQPLNPAKTYFAYVRSLGIDGTPSKKSVTVTFTSSSVRVNALRTQMTGFFSDFNNAPGTLLERDWNTAFSRCSIPDLSASWVNQELHARSMLSSSYYGVCDKGLMAVRPRAIFDFTGRVGTIVFDLDGAFHAQAFFLDILPDKGWPIDVNAHVYNEDVYSYGTPINVLRLRQKDQYLELWFFDENGSPQKLAETASALDSLGSSIDLVRNVRRAWVVKLGQTYFQVSIDGVAVFNTSLSLPFSKAQIQVNTFGWDIQNQDPFQIINWDNFGFDGPNGRSAVVNNYKATSLNSTFTSNFDSSASFLVSIPDSITGATRARLFFSVQLDPLNPTSTPIVATDSVVVNGVATFLTPPVEGTLPQSKIFNKTGPYPMVVSIPLADLARSLNPVSLTIATTAVLFIGNVHIEIEFAKGSNPPYTAPPMWYGKTLSGPMYHPVSNNSFGLESAIYQIGSHDVWGSSRELLLGTKNNLTTTPGAPVTWGTNITILGEVYSESEFGAYGLTHPIKEIRLLADSVVVRNWTFVTNWMTVFGINVSINTMEFGSLLPGGRSVEIYLEAVNTAGKWGRPTYIGATKFGSYWPLKILVS